VTRSRGFWLRTLDGRPASETYAQLFGHPAREWAFPPLSHLARLYPLGVEQGDQMVVRSPIRVEADGSFRMNAPVRDGVDAYLLVGNRDSCEKAAQQAAQQALQGLNGDKPAFALVLVDIAWEMLLKSHPGAEIAAVQDILGKDVPLVGGYTLGQIAPDLPFIKKQSVELLKASYPASVQVDTAIPAALDRFYRESHPAVFASRRADVARAGVALAAIHGRNVFPAMKVTWGTYPNNLGHNDFPGCFRCHGGALKSADESTISQDCNTCHQLLAMEEPAPKVLADLGLAPAASQQ